MIDEASHLKRNIEQATSRKLVGLAFGEFALRARLRG